MNENRERIRLHLPKVGREQHVLVINAMRCDAMQCNAMNVEEGISDSLESLKMMKVPRPAHQTSVLVYT